MKSRTVPAPVDRFLTRTLSGTVFTWREVWELLLPGVLDSLSIMFINMLITALISKTGESSVAAVSLVSPVSALIVNVFSGISAGGTVVVAQCCGRKDIAQKKKAMLHNPKHLVLEAPHPSPLSAYRGFFGCKHFSKTNEFLEANGYAPIDWQIEDI
mgnify:CR=1 FL=1